MHSLLLRSSGDSGSQHVRAGARVRKGSLMTTKQPLARIAIELLHVVHEFAIAVERKSARALRTAYRAGNICAGCDAGLERCGPALWSRGKMCCQHCSHVRPVGEVTVQHGE